MYYLREYTPFLLHCKTMKVAPLLNHSLKAETIIVFNALLSLRTSRMVYARTNNYVILAQKSNIVLCTAYFSISVHVSLITNQDR
jgi:hypothetical protein